MCNRASLFTLGVLLIIGSSLPSAMAGQVVAYTYDQNGRLTSARYSDSIQETFEYDQSGNIVRRSVSPMPAGASRRVGQALPDGSARLPGSTLREGVSGQPAEPFASRHVARLVDSVRRRLDLLINSGQAHLGRILAEHFPSAQRARRTA